MQSNKRSEFIEFWNIPADEADAAWAAKCKMDGYLEQFDGQIRGNEGIIPDIHPYKSMVTGEMIMSRSTHRNHMKDHNVIEVGNEKLSAPPVKKVDWKPEIIRRVYEAKEQQRRNH